MENLIALAIATSILVAIPGPNVALIVANSLRYGLGAGLSTVLGTTLGIALQLVLVVAGMATVVELATDALTWIRWAGVVYLVLLGIRTWRDSSPDLASVEATPAVFWRGCVIAAVNPKTLIFNAAFLPQFISANSSSARIVVIGAVFLGVIIAGDLLWASFANSARRLFGRAARLQNRLAGGFLVAAAIGLAWSRRDT